MLPPSIKSHIEYLSRNGDCCVISTLAEVTRTEIKCTHLHLQGRGVQPWGWWSIYWKMRPFRKIPHMWREDLREEEWWFQAKKPKLEPPVHLHAQTDALAMVKRRRSGVKEAVTPGCMKSRGRALCGGTRNRLSRWVFWYTSAWVWGLSLTSFPWEMHCSHMLDFHTN